MGLYTSTRVPSGVETCQFCVMLASRGFVFNSEVNTSHSHSHCDCVVTPGFANETVVEGYEPDVLYEQYLEARKSVEAMFTPEDWALVDGPTCTKLILQEMRRQSKNNSADENIKHESTTFENCRSTQTYLDTLKVAKSTVVPEARWRVELPESVEEFNGSHKGLRLHITEGGSTVAVDETSDIVAVCKNVDSNERGSDLIQPAVKNGGIKLDSYSGSHAFYVKNGFAPISWCEWVDEYAPPDWDMSFRREPIVFYVYTGKKSACNNVKDFFKDVKPSKDYDMAYKVRDSQIDGGVEN